MIWENIIEDPDNQKYIDEKTLTYRYLLEKDGKRKLIVLGLNPSTADSDKADPTMTRVMQFAEQEGFDSFAMINLYPQRATNPKNVKSFDDEIHKKNLEKIEALVKRIDNPVILLAFGVNILKKEGFLKYFYKIYKSLNENYKPSWKYLELSKDGVPRHVLCLSYSLRMKDFKFGDIEGKEFHNKFKAVAKMADPNEDPDKVMY